MIGVDRPPKRFRPEVGSGVDIVRVAVDQNAIDARSMHGNTSNAGMRQADSSALLSRPA
jgi:hypothetical protein